jgi:hypothetical protein
VKTCSTWRNEEKFLKMSGGNCGGETTWGPKHIEKNNIKSFLKLIECETVE